MPSPKIVIYFTPDVKEIGRIPISDIKYEESKKQERGKKVISLKTPDLINANCSSLRSDIKSTAVLNFKSVTSFGEQTKFVFKVNDYFEIWNEADPDDNFCYFRGVVNQVTSNYTGDERVISLMLENAGGWAFGDNSIYYLSPLIITQQHSTSKFFDPIKTKYGWLENGKETDAAKAIDFTKIKTASKLLETLVNSYVNRRIEILREEFYNNSEIPNIEVSVGDNVSGNQLFIADKMAQMEGSIINILRKYEGRPFAEMFMVENKDKTKVFWRNSRWRDQDNILCMADQAGAAENLVLLYTDPKAKIPSNRQFIDNSQEGYKSAWQYSGFISENINRSNADVVNGIFIYPAVFSTKSNVPTSVLNQSQYDTFDAKQLLDLNSVIRHGYKPLEIRLPFIPSYMESKDYNDSSIDKRDKTRESIYTTQGEYLQQYTQYAYSMFQNIQNSGNGATVFQNNLHVSVADDYRIIRERSEEQFYVNVHKITWYFDANAPKTVFEWDRGFERNKLEDTAKLYRDS
jgi:hypothetical protein